jgi:hypothetical protein
MNKSPDDILIRDMFEAVNTPHYDVSRKVLNRLHTAPQKKILLSKMMVAAAAFCVVIAFFGTIKLIRSHFSSQYIEEYAPVNSQYIEEYAPVNRQEEMENRMGFVFLMAVSKGNDGLATVYPTLN